MDRRGGRRQGAGRPTKEEAARKAKLPTLAIKQGPQIRPQEYLQGVLNSPGSSKSERLRAAELLLKLAPDSPPPHSSATPGIEVVYAVPHGAQLAADRLTLIWPETGERAEPLVLKPFKGTPALTDRREQPEPEPEPARFEVHELEPAQNLVRMDSFKSKRDNEDGGGPDAA